MARLHAAGLVFDKSKNCLARRLKINETGYEGLRLRYNSTFNTVRVRLAVGSSPP